MTWSTVRDNYLLFWTGGNWATDPSYPVSSFTTGQQDQVTAALELLYTRSQTFQAMIDEWIASGGQLQIGATTGLTRAVSFGTDPLNRYILINFDELQSKNWVNNIGELVSDRLEVSLAHEMIHIYKGYGDLPQEATDANKNGTSYDYAGDTVRYQNKIVAELGADFSHYQQVSYGSVSDDYAAHLGLVENQSYTNGEAIDVWRRGSDGNDTLDQSNRTAESTTFGDAPPQLRDLIFGFAGIDTIDGGLGNDFLYGGDNNDFLIGGAGNDQLWGGMLDEAGRADGTDTARYQSAPAGIVINLNGGSGVPITVQDGQGGTDTLHSIEILEGSTHSDTLVLSDLTPEIANDLDYIDLREGQDSVDVSALTGTVRFNGSNSDDQTLTFGDAVLHLRNIESITGNHDTLVLDSSTNARVSFGEKIVISDADIASFSCDLTGHSLTFTGGSLAFGSIPLGKIVASAAAGGGVELTLVPAVAMNDGRSDFNGDGHDDILWRSVASDMSNWLGIASGGFSVNDVNAYTQVPRDWHIAGTGDFNGDGRDDILWRSETGTLSNWLGTASGGFINNDANAMVQVPSDWQVVGTGDFNGDGRDDLLWRDELGALSNWLGTATGGFIGNDANAFIQVDVTWHVVGMGDFNGDGRDDILWRNDAGQLSDWLGTASGGFTNNDTNALTSVPTGAQVVGIGDFNGDGLDDILWRTESGWLSDWLGIASGGFSNNEGNSLIQVPLDWHVAGTGDYNGDGRHDILWRSDGGSLSDWLGTMSGGFINNDSNAFGQVSTDWQIQSPDYLSLN